MPPRPGCQTLSLPVTGSSEGLSDDHISWVGAVDWSFNHLKASRWQAFPWHKLEVWSKVVVMWQIICWYHTTAEQWHMGWGMSW